MKRPLIALAASGLLTLALTAGADVWRSPGKPGAAVQLASQAEHEAGVGDTVEVPLQFNLPRDVDGLRVELLAGDGLSLPAVREHREIGAAAAGTLTLAPARVTVHGEGRHYLGVTVFTSVAGVERFRSFSIALQAGTASKQAANPAKLSVDESGRPIHILPASRAPR